MGKGLREEREEGKVVKIERKRRREVLKGMEEGKVERIKRSEGARRCWRDELN